MAKRKPHLKHVQEKIPTPSAEEAGYLGAAIWSARILIVVLMLGCIYLTPYTKVEESFNLQTIHDLLFLGPRRLKEFDHFEFPGVVPRTCLSGGLISLLIYPYHLLFGFLSSKGLLDYSMPMQKHLLLFAARGTLGLLVGLTWLRLGHILGQHLGRNRDLWFCLFSATQFHFLFWGSRPLPNMFALVLSNLAIGCWIQAIFAPSPELKLNWKKKFLGWMIPAAVILRMECLFFAGFVFLCDLTTNRRLYSWQTFLSLLGYSLLAFGLSLLVTLGVDSVFWQGTVYERSGVVWPEGYVFFFNAIQGKSVAWGVLPFRAYFTSFLPKALGLAYVVALCGLMMSSVSSLVGGAPNVNLCAILLSPALMFVLFMSSLGHKEWRFLVYIFPVFNLAAADSISLASEKNKHAGLAGAARVVMLLALAANLAFAGVSMFVSSINYPGGDALLLTHQLYSSSPNMTIHIDVAAAISGVSRFGQLFENWIYDKTESLQPGQDYAHFDCLLSASPESHALEWEPTAVAYGFDRLQLKSLGLWSKSLLNAAQIGLPELAATVPQLKALHPVHNLTPQKIATLYWLQFLTPLQVNLSPKIFILQKVPPQE